METLIAEDLLLLLLDDATGKVRHGPYLGRARWSAAGAATSAG